MAPIEADEVSTSDTDEPETQLGPIAEQLAELSNSTETPKGWGKPTEPFDKEAVDFSSGAWLLRLCSVHSWLHLDEELSASAALDRADGVLRSLFLTLAEAAPESCYDMSQGFPRLTPQGQEALSARLELALRHRDKFIEDLEELSPKQATRAWEERWEDERDGDVVVDPIHAEVTKFKILDVKNLAVARKLSLNPTYQRGDVWTTPDSQKLVESIVKGIPLPSIIILKTEAGSVYEIVDGKQRLTAVLRFMAQHPSALDLVKRVDAEHNQNDKLTRAFLENYKKFRRMWKSLRGEALTAAKEAEFYFPYRLPGENKLPAGLRHLAGKYYCDVKTERLSVAGKETTIEDLFDGPAPPYELPVIIYHNTKPRQIHEVFNLYNRQGKHLNAEEIRNAIFHEVLLARLLLAAAGDNDNYTALVPYLPKDMTDEMRGLASALKDYKFGTSRYKRTKILSWLCASLLQPAVDANGAFIVRSTASRIDELFRSVQDSPGGHPLRDQKTLLSLLTLITRSIRAHSGASWAPKFRDNDTGEKWQELQLVASLLGTSLLCAAREDAEDVLDAKADACFAFTQANHRPEKTQNITQWRYISRIALGLLEIFEIDKGALDAKLKTQFGHSCLPTLQAAAAMKA